MIVPALEPNVTQVTAYLPSGRWYDVVESTPIHSKGEYVKLDSPLDKINVLVRGGSILPSQPNKLTTTESRKGNFSLIVALDDDQKAFGELYWDDGNSLDTAIVGRFNLFKFASEKVLKTCTIHYSKLIAY